MKKRYRGWLWAGLVVIGGLIAGIMLLDLAGLLLYGGAADLASGERFDLIFRRVAILLAGGGLLVIAFRRRRSS